MRTKRPTRVIFVMLVLLAGLALPSGVDGGCDPPFEQDAVRCGATCADAGALHSCEFGTVPPTHGCLLIDFGAGCTHGPFPDCADCGGGF